MKRLALVATLMVLAMVAMAGASVGKTPLQPGHRIPKPRLIRDAEAGIHEMKVTGEQQADTATEPSIAVNPEDPLNAVAGYQAGRVDGGCAQTLGYATTFDGGKTWDYGPLPKLTKANGGEYDLASDPVVAFGPDDTVYYNSLLCDGAEGELGFSVSHNGGKTWSDPIVVPSEQTFPNDDKNWIIVDNGTGPGHHTGRIYLVWDNIAPVVAVYSDDEAKTWQGPFVIYPGQGIGTLPLIMPNGDLGVVFGTIAGPLPPLHGDPMEYEAEDELTLDKFVISLAPGAGSLPTGAPLAFGPPTTIAAYRGTDVRQHRAAEDLPTAGVDPKTGRIYVAWGDNRFREDDVNDIVITHSDDQGATWTKPTKINRGKPSDWVEHFTPALEVAPDGKIAIAYRTQQQASSLAGFSPYVDTFFQQSSDNGKTWSAPLKLNRHVRTDVSFAAYSRQSAFLGDYNQMAINGSFAYFVRAEAYSIKPNEPRTFPPSVHHQRAWVSLVDLDGNGKP